MTQLIFGAGAVWGINTAANSTPARFGVLQDVSIDFSASTKTLFGQYNLPFSVARGAISTKGKMVMGQINSRIINELFFGGSASAGQVLAIDNEAGSVPGSSTYTITVANSANWATDLGVSYASSGLPLTRVASGPTVGQYSVAAGVYTFAAADASTAMKLSYTYTSTTPGQTIAIAQQAMGTANTFKTVASFPFNGQKATFTLNACISNKLAFASKLEDYMKPEFDFEAFADSAGNLGTIAVAEVA